MKMYVKILIYLSSNEIPFEYAADSRICDY